MATVDAAGLRNEVWGRGELRFRLVIAGSGQTDIYSARLAGRE